MTKRRIKSVIAVLLCFAMIFATQTAVFATEPAAENTDVETETTGSTNGIGAAEGVISTNIFKVSVPVTSASVDKLEFVLDPQGLIKETGAKRYGWGASDYDDTATLYFISQNSGMTSNKKYGKTSNPLSVNNLSSVSVDVGLTVDVTGRGDLTLSNNSTFTDTDPAMFMKLVTKIGDRTDYAATKLYSGDDTAITGSTTSSNILALIPKADNGYVFDWSESTGYTYLLSSNYVAGASENTALYFWFEGASNKADGTKANEDLWLALKDIQPKLSVIWNVKPHSEGPEVTINSSGLITISNMSEGKLFQGATLSNGTDTWNYSTIASTMTRDDSNYNNTTGGTITLQLLASAWRIQNGKTVTIVVTFTDGTTEEASVVLAM